ncbi:MAG TPA: ABC transporter substrate-binding protein [Longimicrobiales bacterium]
MALRWIVAACSLVWIVACASPRTPKEEREYRAAHGDGDIVIAAVWPWKARKDILFGQGLELALEEAALAGGLGGRRIRLLKEDDHESVDEGLLLAQRLANDPEVVAVIGHLQSYVAIPAAAIYDLAGIVLICPTSTSPALTNEGYERVFRTTFTDDVTGREMADFAFRQGYRRVAVYYIRNAYGRSLANAFEERAAELGIAIVQRASYDPDRQRQHGPGFEPTFREWSRLDLDALFVAGQAPEAGFLIAEARRNGITVPVLGSDAMATQSLIAAGGAAVEGTVLPAAFHPDDERQAVRRFVRAFTERFGKPPDVGAALAYDALSVLVHAIRKAGTPAPGEVARALRTMRDWEGVTGRFGFDDRGELIEPRLVKVVVRNGRFEYLDEGALAGRERSGAPARGS